MMEKKPLKYKPGQKLKKDQTKKQRYSLKVKDLMF